jgi:hypothetical protein
MNNPNSSEVLVHKFNMGDVEDPYIFAAQPLWEWQNTDVGKWVMENAIEQPTFYCRPNDWMGIEVQVYAKLTDKDRLFFNLKYT